MLPMLISFYHLLFPSSICHTFSGCYMVLGCLIFFPPTFLFLFSVLEFLMLCHQLQSLFPHPCWIHQTLHQRHSLSSLYWFWSTALIFKSFPRTSISEQIAICFYMLFTLSFGAYTIWSRAILNLRSDHPQRPCHTEVRFWCLLVFFSPLNNVFEFLCVL